MARSRSWSPRYDYQPMKPVSSIRQETPSIPKRMARASSFNIVVVLSIVCFLRLFVTSGSGPASFIPSRFSVSASCKSEGHDIIVADDDISARRGLSFDFAVIGFPKTGTSFLLEVLKRHSQIEMPRREFCEIHGPDGDKRAMDWLRNHTSTTPLTSEAPLKYGIKCPTMIRNADAIDNLAKMSQHTRLLLGLRHPVSYFESFYNYRVLEHYDTGSNATIPTPLELSNGTKHWRDVSLAYARYELFMQQLAKVPMSSTEMQDVLDERLFTKQISPNPFKVFLYTMDQLRDQNELRRTKFQTDLQEFLGLKIPLMDFTKLSKVNSAENHKRRPELIDICDIRYDGIRKHLLESGRKTSLWVRNKFIKSPNVVVSSEDYFSAILSTWGQDPCK